MVSDSMFIKEKLLHIEEIKKIERLSQIIKDIDHLFAIVYGKGYPYFFKNIFHTIGSKSYFLCVWYNQILVGFVGYVHDEENNRIEAGRLIKDPNYNFEINVLVAYIFDKDHELKQESESLIYGTSRIWISGYFLELGDFNLTGSIVHDGFSISPWDEKMAHIFLGFYNYVNPERLKLTQNIPKWVRDVFPNWKSVFNQYKTDCELHDFDGQQTLIENIKITEFENNDGCQIYIPCINEKKILEKLIELKEDGYCLMAIFPSWVKINYHGKPRYIHQFFLQKRIKPFQNYPKRFKLSPVHHEFINKVNVTKNGEMDFFRKPIQDLFAKRNIPIKRRLVMEISKKYYIMRIHNLWNEEHNILNATSRVLGG
jgi:hypothetical protein